MPTRSAAPAALRKSGAGTTTLTGTNSYTGTTTITAGTLQIGNGGSSGTLGTGAIINSAILTVNRSDAFTLTNAISGTGRLIQLGTGTTTLTANNTYTGTTTISAGALEIGNGGTTGTMGTGAVTNNGVLRFNRSNAFTVANAISGTGAVTQIGAGITTLTGANSFTGVTTISSRHAANWQRRDFRAVRNRGSRQQLSADFQSKQRAHGRQCN